MFNSIHQLRGLLLITLLCFITACGSGSGSGGPSVSVYVTGVELNAAHTSFAKGVSQLIEGEATFSDAETRSASSTSSTWSSDDESIATVDIFGVVTGMSEGITTINAVYNGAQNEEGEFVTATIEITITAAEVREIEIYSVENTVPLGNNIQYQAFAIYTDENYDELDHSDIVWISSDPTVATIDGAGLTDTLTAGETTISVNYQGLQSSTLLTVTNATLVSLTISPVKAGAITVAEGHSISFTAEAAYTDDTTQTVTNQVTWVSSNDHILSLSETNGTFKGVASGLAEVTAIFETITSTSIYVLVTEAPGILLSVSIATEPESVYSYPIGVSTQLIAMGYFSNGSSKELTSDDNVSIVWENTANDVISLEAEGLLTAKNPGETIVFLTVTPVENEALKAEQDFTITEAVLKTITIVPNHLYLVPGQSHQYIAMGEYTDESKNILNNQEDIVWSISEMFEGSGAESAVSIHPKTGLIRNHFYNGLTKTEQVSIHVSVGDHAIVDGRPFANLGAVRVLSSDNLSFTGTFLAYDVMQLQLTITSEEVNVEDGMSGPENQSFIMLTYDEAESVCQELVYNKHTNYRLPTSTELTKLWNDKTADPAVDYEFYTKYNWSVGENYWTSTTEDLGETYKVIDLGKGEEQPSSISTEFNYVSCVRSPVSP